MADIQGIKQVELSLVRQNPHALREVDVTSEEFLGIMSNIEADFQKLGDANGVVIDVREAIDPVTKEAFYEVVDGGHRFVALQKIGASKVNVFVVRVNDTEALTRQITKNLHNKQTKHVELASALKTILTNDKNCSTVEDLAILIKKSPEYVKQILKLNGIKNEVIAKQIDAGQISLNNAFTLLKLPEKDQVEFLDAAIVDTNDIFKGKVADHLKVLRAERAKGDPGKGTQEFTPVKFIRNKNDIVNALTNPASLEGKLPAQSVHEAIRMTLEWVLCIDAESQAAQKASWDARIEQKAKSREAKAKAKELADSQKAAAAAETAVSAE